MLAWHDAEPVHSVVEHGCLAIGCQRTRSGELYIADVLARGSCFVPRPLFLSDHCDWMTITLTPVTVLQMPLDRYMWHLSHDAALAAAAAEAKGRQYEALLHRLAVLGLAGALPRTAGTLLYLADRMAERCPLAGGRMMPLTQHVVAGIADLTRQTANAELKRLQRARLVHLERGFVCLLQPERLREIAAGHPLRAAPAHRTTCRYRHPEKPLDCVQPVAAKGGGHL